MGAAWAMVPVQAVSALWAPGLRGSVDARRHLEDVERARDERVRPSLGVEHLAPRSTTNGSYPLGTGLNDEISCRHSATRMRGNKPSP